jgi:hypothetical protein
MASMMAIPSAVAMNFESGVVVWPVLMPAKKIYHIAIEHFGDLEQPSSADAVRALLVFLNLLEADAERFTKLFLAYPLLQSTRPHAISDKRIGFCGGAAGRAFRTSWSLSVYHHRVPQNWSKTVFNGWGAMSSRFGNAFNFNEEIRMRKRGAECRARRKASFRPRFRINLVHPSPILYAREDYRAFENTVKTACRRLKYCSQVCHGLSHLRIEVSLRQFRVRRKGSHSRYKNKITTANGL